MKMRISLGRSFFRAVYDAFGQWQMVDSTIAQRMPPPFTGSLWFVRVYAHTTNGQVYIDHTRYTPFNPLLRPP